MKVVRGLLILIFVCFMCSAAATQEAPDPEVGDQKPEVKKEEPIGLKSGTVIPQDILKRITQHQNDLNYSTLQQIAIKLAIDKYQALWTKEFDVWLASEKVPLAELRLWTIRGNKAVLKGK